MKTPGAAYGNYQGIVKGREGVYVAGFSGVFGRVPPSDGSFQAVSGVAPKLGKTLVWFEFCFLVFAIMRFISSPSLFTGSLILAPNPSRF